MALENLWKTLGIRWVPLSFASKKWGMNVREQTSLMIEGNNDVDTEKLFTGVAGLGSSRYANHSS
ncbi:hypothetical protein AL542_18355 [Grimontia hollisae]|nr:hypothetical protein AL542_18355 [Grimontia hollisae]